MSTIKPILLSLATLTACVSKPSTESVEKQQIETSVQASDSVEGIVLESMDTKGNLPLVEGTLVDQQSWTDNGGTWYCALTQQIDIPNEFATFRWYKFKQDQNGNLAEFQVYIDSLNCGDADIIAKIDTRKMLLTDLDNDNRAELTFVYTLSCTYDISPQRRILVINRDSSMHKLSGFTLDAFYPIPKENDLNLQNFEKDEDDYWIPPVLAGRYENESDFSSLPDSFLTHAKTIWFNILKTDKEELE